MTANERPTVTETAEPPSGKYDDIRWTLLDLKDLVDVYLEVIVPTFTADSHDPKMDRPTHEWLSANGFRGLIYALREYHDRTFGEFWHEDLGLDPADAGYDWGISHEETITLLETYLDSRRDRGELSELSVERPCAIGSRGTCAPT